MKVDLLSLLYKGFLFLLIIVVAIVLTKLLGKWLVKKDKKEEIEESETHIKGNK